MAYCPEYEVEIVMWCRWWVPVYKREHFLTDWTYDPLKDVYSDGLDGTWRTPWECAWTKYDYEKLVLCSLTWEKILVESWVDVSDPTQTRTTRYTDLATWLAYAWNISDLSDCGQEKFDIQTKQYCDGGETIFWTLVFNVTWTLPSLVWIVFNKIDWSVHTPVSPVEWACWSNLPLVISSEWVNIWSSITVPAWAVYAVVSVTLWEWVITVDWTTPVAMTVWHPIYEWQKIYLQIADEVNNFQSAWTWTMFITYYDKALRLSQQ